MSRRMRVVLGVVCVTLGLADGARSQSSVLVRTATGCTPYECFTWVFTYDPDAQIVRSAAPVVADTGAYVTPDGATFVALHDGGTQLSLLDRASGVETLRPLAAPAWALVGNPTRPEVYVTDTSRGLALAPAGARPLATPPCQSPIAQSVSADGRRVVYKCFPGNGNPGYSAVIDTATGALVRAMPSGWSPVLNGDGTVLYQTETDVSGMLLRRYVVDTGVREAEAVLDPYFETPRLAFDSRRQRLFSLGTQARVFDGVTLDSLAYLTCGASASDVAFDRDEPRVFLVGTRSFEPFITSDGWLCDVDTITFTVNVLRTYSMPFGHVPSVTVAEAPRAPVSLAAQVAGAAVSLSWQSAGPPAAISRYVLEVGSAPGRNDIFSGLDVGLQTSFGASSVPPGTYYVRVRAGNYTGLGAPSNEVVLAMP